VISKFNTPGDWQFPFATLRQGEDAANVVTTDCDKTIDGLKNSPNGTGSGGNLDFSKRTDAHFQRAEKVGTAHLEVHADGVTRPGLPATWDGDIAFISYDSLTQTATLCILFISTDTRVSHLPDTNPAPSDTKDDIEGVTEIVAEFPVTLVSIGPGNAWQTVADLSDLAKDDTFQQLNVSLIELKAIFNANSAGNWQSGGSIPFSVTPAVSGTKTFSGEFTTCPPDDPAYGNCKSDKGTVTRTIPKTITLVAPVVTAPAANAFVQTTGVTVSGTSDPNASVRVYEGATNLGETTATGAGSWSTVVTLAEGPGGSTATHTVKARTFDLGGESVDSNTRTFTVNAPPAAPIITGPGEGDTVGGGNIPISGTAQPGSTVKVYEGATLLNSGTAGGTGLYTVVVNITAKTAHSITTTATDLGGESAPSLLRTFNVTTAVPVITAPVQNAAFNVANISVTGTSEPGAFIDLTLDGLPGGTTTATGGGAWSIPLTGLSEATHTLTATATNDALTSPASPLRTFIIDFTPPAKPIIITPSPGEEVASSLLNISGTTEPFATVTVKEGTTTIGTPVVANSSGNWSLHPVLTPVQHTVTATATDRAGNIGLPSDPRTFTVVVSALINTPAPNSSQKATFNASGTADGSVTKVEIYEGAAKIATANGVSGGNWSVQLLNLARGNHTIRALAYAGVNVGRYSDYRSFKVDNSGPTLTLTNPSGGVAVLVSGQMVTGTATDNNNSFDTGVKYIQATYTPIGPLPKPPAQNAVCTGCTGGSVTFTLRPGVASGLYTVTITAYDAVGNASTSKSFTMAFV
jgi:hypothetical protein